MPEGRSVPPWAPFPDALFDREPAHICWLLGCTTRMRVDGASVVMEHRHPDGHVAALPIETNVFQNTDIDLWPTVRSWLGEQHADD